MIEPRFYYDEKLGEMFHHEENFCGEYFVIVLVGDHEICLFLYHLHKNVIKLQIDIC